MIWAKRALDSSSSGSRSKDYGTYNFVIFHKIVSGDHKHDKEKEYHERYILYREGIKKHALFFCILFIKQKQHIDDTSYNN